MTWTYNPESISTNLNKVRLLIGDTNDHDQQFSDEEVTFFINQGGTIYGAAALACDALASKFAREVDKEVGDLKISASQKGMHYKTEADRFRKLQRMLATPIAGGVTISGKDAVIDDSDRAKPSFARGQFSNQDATTDSVRADYTGEDN